MTESETDVRVAVWGAGVMGERVARSAAKLPGVAVAAVIDLDAGRARSVADAVGACSFASLADAVASAGVTAVYIGLPNTVHRDACLEAARCGLDVLIDKPLTTSLRDAEEVLDAASESGRYWMMGFSYRFRTEWQRARDIVLSGGIGEPYFVSDNVIEAYRSTPAWYWSAAAGGGALQLQSHHVFDRWEWVLGKRVSTVTAQLLAPSGADADLSAIVNARFGPSLIGTSALSFGVGYDAAPRVSFTVQGTRGMIELDESRRLTVSTDAGILEETHDGDWLAAELSAFVAGVRGEAQGQPTIADGRRAVLLAEAAASSASDGVWVATEFAIDRRDQ